MLSEQHRTEAQFKCGFCGFVYVEFEEAQECELNCVTRALSLVELKERRLH
jgi:rubredoxin